jgi:high-affinity iron transporter
MLATLVIGLREGLEASLIVGIIAAFLRRAGKPLRPMWIGVAIAVALSIAVGVTLQLVSASLPQAAQEGMESVIGLVAVTIVTGMIGWMNVHARTMKKELEQHASEALRDGTAWALAGMAFLAVLKEGFETSVFLLAAFQSSTSVVAATAGAVIGIAIAVVIGVGIFRGGVRLNLGRFFRVTGMFLVLVAAGLVLTSLRTAHEAGWINIGQQQVVDLSWLAPAGSVQAALFTGVLGIPADPRLIEVLGWLAYLVPTFAFLLWPAKARPTGRSLAVFRVSLAAGLVLVGAVLAVAVAQPSYQPSNSVSIVSSDGSKGTATLTSNGNDLRYASSLRSGWNSGALRLADAPKVTRDGVRANLVTTHLVGAAKDGAAKQPTTLTLTELVAMNDGRIPIGMNATENPGPFTAKWTSDSTTKLWIYDSGFVDATSSSVTIATLTGGGLASSRTLTPASAQSPDWHMASAARTAAVSGIDNATNARAELLLWKLWIPIVLVLAALVLCGFVLRTARPTIAAQSSRSPKENYA